MAKFTPTKNVTEHINDIRREMINSQSNKESEGDKIVRKHLLEEKQELLIKNCSVKK